jgi:hypothetical protein
MLAATVGFYDGQEEPLLPTEGGLPVAPAVVEAVTPIPAPRFPGPPPEARVVPSVELTVYVLKGSDSEVPNQQLPQDWDSTVRQVRAKFPYKHYALMDTRVLRSRSGGDAEATANVSGLNFTYNVSPRVIPGKTPRKLRLSGFRVSLRTPVVVDGKTQYQDNGISTELDAQEGQKTVVGKTNFAGDAMIVVVSPKVVE